MTMTERLTDDEIRRMRENLWDWDVDPNRADVERLLDEIEERRRADARWAETLAALDEQQRKDGGA